MTSDIDAVRQAEVAEVTKIINNVIGSSTKIKDWLTPGNENIKNPSGKEFILTMLPMDLYNRNQKKKKFQSVRERNASRWSSRRTRLSTSQSQKQTQEECQINQKTRSSYSSSTSEEDGCVNSKYLKLSRQSDQDTTEENGSSNESFDISSLINRQQFDSHNNKTADPLKTTIIHGEEDCKNQNSNRNTSAFCIVNSEESSRMSGKSLPETSSDDFTAYSKKLPTSSSSCSSASSSAEIKDLSFTDTVAQLNIVNKVSGSINDESKESKQQAEDGYDGEADDDTEKGPSILPFGALESFYCPQCMGRKFSHSDTLGRHMLKCHNLNLKKDDLKKLNSIYFSNKQYSISENKKDSLTSNDDQDFKRLYSRPFGQPPRSKPPPQKSPFDSSELNMDVKLNVTVIPAISKARSDDGVITCLKCDCSFLKENEFYHHIKTTHVWSEEERQRLLIQKGAEQSEFWCPECSESYVTKSALCKHLKGNHEFLTDISEYMEKIGYEGKIPLQENQCDICFSLFDESWEFEKHFRTHGLAFLRRQQLLALIRK